MVGNLEATWQSAAMTDFIMFQPDNSKKSQTIKRTRFESYTTMMPYILTTMYDENPDKILKEIAKDNFDCGLLAFL
jgi:hypothetical protein